MKSQPLSMATTLAGALLAGLVALAPAARAEFFEYSTNVSATNITGISSISGNDSSLVTLTTPNGDTITVDGTTTSGPDHINASAPGTDLSFSHIGVTVGTNTPAQDISFGLTYTLTLTNYEQATGGSSTGTATITFTGSLSGSLGAGRKANLNNLMLSPTSGSVVIGNTQYNYSLNAFSPAGPDATGAVGAHIVSQAVPEPAGVISIALGFLGLVGLASRKRILRRPMAAA